MWKKEKTSKFNIKKNEENKKNKGRGISAINGVLFCVIIIEIPFPQAMARSKDEVKGQKKYCFYKYLLLVSHMKIHETYTNEKSFSFFSFLFNLLFHFSIFHFF